MMKIPKSDEEGKWKLQVYYMLLLGFALVLMLLLVVGIYYYGALEQVNGSGKRLLSNANFTTSTPAKLLTSSSTTEDYDGDGGDDDNNGGNWTGDNNGDGGGDGGDGSTNRVGMGGARPCSKENILVYQGATSPMPNGIPTYTVDIQNVCLSGSCSISGIHVSCGWFSSARLVNPRIFRRIDYDDCLVNDGEALNPGEALTFQYANTFKYPLSVSSVSC
ncbi:hypothetical protein ABFS83_13G135000 [Erythranthe nasuta]